MVRLSFRWRYVTLAVALSSVMLFAVGPIRGELVKFVFFPSPEAENIRAQIYFNAGIPEDEALEIIGKVEGALYQATSELEKDETPLVNAVFSTLGQAGRGVGDNLAEMSVQLSSSEVRTVRTPAIVLPGARNCQRCRCAPYRNF